MAQSSSSIHHGGFLYIISLTARVLAFAFFATVSDIIPDASLEGVTIISPESSLISDLHLPGRSHHHLFNVSRRKISSPLNGAASFFLRCQNVLNAAGSCLISCQCRAPIQMPRGPGARFGTSVQVMTYPSQKLFLTRKGWRVPGHLLHTPPDLSLFGKRMTAVA